MNVNVERGTPIIPMNETALGQNTSNEDFENLLNIIGLMGGFDPETFEQ